MTKQSEVIRAGKQLEELAKVNGEIKQLMRVLDRLMQDKQRIEELLDGFETDLQVDIGRGKIGRGRGNAPS